MSAFEESDAAKLRDLCWHPTLTAHRACGHTSEISVEVLGRRLPMTMPVTDLYHHLRCASCDERGRVEIDARKTLGYNRVE
jgi:hypothetical protein